MRYGDAYVLKNVYMVGSDIGVEAVAAEGERHMAKKSASASEHRIAATTKSPTAKAKQTAKKTLTCEPGGASRAGAVSRCLNERRTACAALRVPHAGLCGFARRPLARVLPVLVSGSEGGRAPCHSEWLKS